MKRHNDYLKIKIGNKYTHKKTKVIYVPLYVGLYQNKKGKWKTIVIYITDEANKGKVCVQFFVRQVTDFLKSFERRDK